jgi:type IV secretory pathway VirB4 component
MTCFDYKNGMMATALACGGRHHDIANEVHRNGMLCPLGVLEDEIDQEWAADYLAVLYHLQTAHDPDSELRTDIIDAVRSLAAAPRHLRTMSNFVGALQNIEARRVFEFYTMKGTAGRFLDGVADPDDDCDFLVYETEDLMTLGDQVSLATLLYQFRRFERSLKGQPSILFLAEAWQVIGHEIWRNRLDKWLRTLRSKNCSVVMDTQSLADIAGSPMLTRMVEACQRKVFLANSAAMQSTGLGGSPGPYELYRIFGLNDRQIAIIKNATPKREYYVTGPDGCRKAARRHRSTETTHSARCGWCILSRQNPKPTARPQ